MKKLIQITCIVVLSITACKNTETKNQKTDKDTIVVATEKDTTAETENPNAGFYMNLVYGENDKQIVKVDRIGKEKITFSLWIKPTKVEDKPDTYLENGVVEKQGSAGGYHFNFIDDEWKIIVEMNSMGESDETTGLFLKMYKNDVEKINSKLKNLKEK